MVKQELLRKEPKREKSLPQTLVIDMKKEYLKHKRVTLSLESMPDVALHSENLF